MINFDLVTGKNTEKHNPYWPHISDHLFRILLVGGSRSRKTNALLNLINHQSDSDKIILYTKALNDLKYKY